MVGELLNVSNLSPENIEILPTAFTVISSSIILYITLIITEHFQNKVSRKRRKMYIKFLRNYHQVVDNCIQDFEKTKLSEGRLFPKDIWQIISEFLGLILGFFLTFIIFIICIAILKIDAWSSMAYSSLVNILPYILTIELNRYIIKEERNLVEVSNKIECWFKGISLFIMSSNILIILYRKFSIT